MILDNIEYEFTQANFIKAKNQALKLGGLLKGCFTNSGDNTNIDIGQALANLGSEETRQIEEFIISTLTAKDENGKPINLRNTDDFNSHFNQHRDHYFQVLIEGMKFHFLGFLPSGIASKLNTLNLEALVG